MRDIADMRARLDAAPDLPSLLTVSRDAFSLMRVICRACEDRSDELFAAFAMAAASARHARNLVTQAPSMTPAHPAIGRTEITSVGSGLDDIADALADLASVLASRLRRGGSQAAEAGDRTACQDAAGEADSIRSLLARDG